VRARGSARQRLFQADADREEFVQRLARVAQAEALTVYAWALVPNHFHLLVRTGRQPLARSLRALLTGSAGAVNRRSRRSGPVFQHRYQSVVCDEAVYLLALVRSLHLKPVRARSVAALEGVAQSADSGHGASGGREGSAGEERIVGSREFVEQVRRRCKGVRRRGGGRSGCSRLKR